MSYVQMRQAHHVYVCVFAGSVLSGKQRGANGQHFSKTGASPEGHQPPIHGPCDQGHYSLRTEGPPEAYNG